MSVAQKISVPVISMRGWTCLGDGVRRASDIVAEVLELVSPVVGLPVSQYLVNGRDETPALVQHRRNCDRVEVCAVAGLKRYLFVFFVFLS